LNLKKKIFILIQEGIRIKTTCILGRYDTAKKMIWCIEHPIEANQLGINAEKMVRVKYDKSLLLQKNLVFYKKIIK